MVVVLDFNKFRALPHEPDIVAPLEPGSCNDTNSARNFGFQKVKKSQEPFAITVSSGIVVYFNHGIGVSFSFLL